MDDWRQAPPHARRAEGAMIEFDFWTAIQARAATVRLATPPGQQAHVDGGSGGGWRVGEHRRGPVLVMGLGDARALQVECPAAERLPTVWSGHAPALEGCGGIPEASLSCQ